MLFWEHFCEEHNYSTAVLWVYGLRGQTFLFSSLSHLFYPFWKESIRTHITQSQAIWLEWMGVTKGGWTGAHRSAFPFVVLSPNTTTNGTTKPVLKKEKKSTTKPMHIYACIGWSQRGAVSPSIVIIWSYSFGYCSGQDKWLTFPLSIPPL